MPTIIILRSHIHLSLLLSSRRYLLAIMTTIKLVPTVVLLLSWVDFVSSGSVVRARFS